LHGIRAFGVRNVGADGAIAHIYNPLRCLPADAYQFLSDVPKLEAAGIIVRAPGAWQAGRPARPLVKASIGTRAPSLLGKDALLDFGMEVARAAAENGLPFAEAMRLVAGA